MINFDNMRWYHAIWFIPFLVIGSIVMFFVGLIVGVYRSFGGETK